MYWTRRIAGACCLALILAFSTSHARFQPPDAKLAIDKITYANLGKLVRGLKGKIILVDFWAEY